MIDRHEYVKDDSYFEDPPARYKKFRKDGWPYCPQCEEDELYSLSVPATAETIIGCYICGWTPRCPTPAVRVSGSCS